MVQVAPKGNSGKTLIPQSGMTTTKYPGQSPIVSRTRQLLISSDRIEEERFQTKKVMIQDEHDTNNINYV